MAGSEFGASTVIAAALGLVSTAVAWLAGRKPAKADYADRLLDATIPAAEMLSKRLADMETRQTAIEARASEAERRAERAEREVQGCELRHDRLQADHVRLRRQYEHLIDYLSSLDLKPPPIPDDD